MKILSKKQHYLDVSEAIRSIVRKKCTALLDPYSGEMAKFRKEKHCKENRNQGK